MNKIYNKLLEIKINKFLLDFYSTSELYEKLENKNNLLHAGEFGMHKERICDDIIKFAIPGKFETGTGFLINSIDEVSTQCDIIIFDKNNTPLIENEDELRFFPAETVIGLGEIKSKITKKLLLEALLKLAKNKKIRDVSNFRLSEKQLQKTFKMNPMDTMFSFIICNEIENFDHKSIFESIDKMYADNNIEYQFRHNMVVSLKNGVLSYQDNSVDHKEGNPPFPNLGDETFRNVFVKLDDSNGIAYLLGGLANFLNTINVYYPDPMFYK